jgi:hypothetical protein
MRSKAEVHPSTHPNSWGHALMGRACDKSTRRAEFRLTRRAKHFYNFARLVPKEGRIAIVTKRGMGCGGR